MDIKILEANISNRINAEDLYKKLEILINFDLWIKNQIKELKLEENNDYICNINKKNIKNEKQLNCKYFLTIDSVILICLTLNSKKLEKANSNIKRLKTLWAADRKKIKELKEQKKNFFIKNNSMLNTKEYTMSYLLGNDTLLDQLIKNIKLNGHYYENYNKELKAYKLFLHNSHYNLRQAQDAFIKYSNIADKNISYKVQNSDLISE